MRKGKIKISIKPDVKSYKRISRDVFINTPTYTRVHRDHSKYYRPEEKRKIKEDHSE